MRSLTEMVEEIVVIRTNAKYTFMSPEAVAALMQTQAIERVAAALERANTMTPLPKIGPAIAQASEPVTNQRLAEAPVIPQFTQPQGQQKRK